MNTKYAPWEGEVGSEQDDVVVFRSYNVLFFFFIMFIFEEKWKIQNLEAALQ